MIYGAIALGNRCPLPGSTGQVSVVIMNQEVEMDQLNEILARLNTIGISGLMAISLGWIGKRYLDSKLESEKAVNQENMKSLESRINQSLEVHKQKVKNGELFFQKQFEASQELYRIKTDMMPPYRHPDMDWHEAIEEMANGLENTHKLLREFMNSYFTVLKPDILEKLETAAGDAEEGMLYGGGDDGREPGNQCAERAYNLIKECTSLLKAEVDGQRLVEFHEHAEKSS